MGVALAALLSTSIAAHAQPTEKPNDAAESAYQEGKRLYDVQEWDAAIAKFKEAYRLRADQPSLFNIAQSYRLKGDCTNAIATYKTYKRNFPAADNIPKVEKFITDLEGSCTKTPVGTTPTGTTPTGTTPTGTTPTGTTPTGTTPTGTTPAITTNPNPTGDKPIGTTPTGTTPTGTTPTGVTTTDNRSFTPGITAQEDEDPGKTKRYAGYGLIGFGGIGLVAGVVFAVSAHNHATTVTNGGGDWDPGVETAGEKAQRNSRIGFAVGGVAIAGGLALVLLNGAPGPKPSRMAIVPSADGASLVFGGHF